MKSSLCFVLIFSAVAISATTLDNFQILSQCDQTVSNGVAVCLQHFSPIKFVTDIIGGNKDSLCCTHFKHNACIRGVKDAVKVAKSANLCPNSFSDSLISTLTDSSINNYIIRSCKSFNTEKCVLDSVGDVVNTIQGFFVPQQKQQKPVIPQVIDNIFNRENTNTYNRENTYSRENPNTYNSNVNNDRSSLFNSFREVRNRYTSTENPLINKSIRDIFNGQYIPEASVLKPISDMINGRTQTTSTESPLRSLFSGIVSPTNTRNSKPTEETSILDSIGSLFNTNNNENQSIFQSFGDIFNPRGTEDSYTVITDTTE